MNWTRQDTRDLIEAVAEKPCVSVGVVRVIRRHYAEDGLIERMARFESFCDRTMSVPHIWGASDCSLMIADWVVENGHADPAARWRGTYETEDACKALLESRGWLIGHVRDCAAQIGLRPLHEPEFGCIAVIGSERNPDRQWSAIWNGRRWIVRWLAKQNGEVVPTWSPFAARPLAMWVV